MKLFLFKNLVNDEIMYLDTKIGFECDHYFSGLHLCNGCTYGSDFPSYNDIETVLTKDEYNYLIELNNELHNLGYGIVKGDGRYNKGLILIDNINHIINKLIDSEENEKLYNELIKEEIEYLKDEYYFNDEDLEIIFKETEYKDRSIINCVYSDVYEFAEEEIDSCFNVDDAIKPYIDYEKFGNDAIDGYNYIETSSGRIVYLNR